MKIPKELKIIKDQMQAIQHGDYTVEATNPRVVKCWERLQCPKTECPAHGKLRCWSVAGTFCRGKVQGVFAQKIGDCRECVVYKESCGDEVGELIEAFNQMVKDIKYTFHEQKRSGQEKARCERLTELGDMVAAVAHETRNPLHAIGMAASYLKKHFQGELVSEFASIIEEEVGKLSDLTSLFLSFSLPAPLGLELCAVNGVVQASAALFQAETERKGIALSVEPDPALPDIETDPSRVREIVSNLIENSLESSTKGGSIRVRTEAEPQFVRISVQDTGAGIEPGEREKIFRPFYTTKTRGPGLGLALVERSVRELNGRIELESIPGEGTTFSVLLPLARQEDL